MKRFMAATRAAPPGKRRPRRRPRGHASRAARTSAARSRRATLLRRSPRAARPPHPDQARAKSLGPQRPPRSAAPDRCCPPWLPLAPGHGGRRARGPRRPTRPARSAGRSRAPGEDAARGGAPPLRVRGRRRLDEQRQTRPARDVSATPGASPRPRLAARAQCERRARPSKPALWHGAPAVALARGCRGRPRAHGGPSPAEGLLLLLLLAPPASPGFCRPSRACRLLGLLGLAGPSRGVSGRPHTRPSRPASSASALSALPFLMTSGSSASAAASGGRGLGGRRRLRPDLGPRQYHVRDRRARARRPSTFTLSPSVRSQPRRRLPSIEVGRMSHRDLLGDVRGRGYSDSKLAWVTKSDPAPAASRPPAYPRALWTLLAA